MNSVWALFLAWACATTGSLVPEPSPALEEHEYDRLQLNGKHKHKHKHKHEHKHEHEDKAKRKEEHMEKELHKERKELQHTQFSHVRTDQICHLDMNHKHHDKCQPSAAQTHAHELGELVQSMGPKFHLLCYGPSWMRQVSEAVMSAVGHGAVTRKVWGENDAKDHCYCGLRGDICPCADFETTTFGSGLRVTNVINYAALQLKQHVGNLKATLKEHDFTHAFVMEPHVSCYFDKCDGHGTCPGCQSLDEKEVYGCGWGDEMWSAFTSRFPHDLVHVVPWNVPASYAVRAPSIAVRTRGAAERFPCEAVPSTDKHGVMEAKALAHAGPGLVDAGHQCLVVCGGSHDDPSGCHDGSHAIMAFDALTRLKQGPNGTAAAPPPQEEDPSPAGRGAEAGRAEGALEGADAEKAERARGNVDAADAGAGGTNPPLDYRADGPFDAGEASQANKANETGRSSGGEGAAASERADHYVCEHGHCYPTFFLLGMQKAATTSIFARMMKQGVVCDAEVAGVADYAPCLACSGKETHFFTGLRDSDGGEVTIHGRGWKTDATDPREGFTREDYTQLFPEEKMGRVGCDRFIEATPALQHKSAARRMSLFLPAAIHPRVKILVVLREPVSRDLSWYNHQVDSFYSGGHLATQKEPPPAYGKYVFEETQLFEECVTAAGGDALQAARECYTPAGEPKTPLMFGMYSSHLERLNDSWLRQQVMVLQMEALLDDTHGLLTSLYSFIGATKAAPMDIPKENSHDSPHKITSIPCHVKASLDALFEPHTKQLFAMLGRQRDRRPAEEPDFPAFPDTVECHGEAGALWQHI